MSLRANPSQARGLAEVRDQHNITRLDDPRDGNLFSVRGPCVRENPVWGEGGDLLRRPTRQWPAPDIGNAIARINVVE
jgi:hypothetical protein